MEVTGLNSGKFFARLFYPAVNTLLEYLKSHDVTLAWFLLYNFVAVTLLLLKLSKDTATMVSLSTHQFSSYLYTRFTL